MKQEPQGAEEHPTALYSSENRWLCQMKIANWNQSPGGGGRLWAWGPQEGLGAGLGAGPSRLATAHDSLLPGEAGEREKSALVPSGRPGAPPVCFLHAALGRPSGPLCFALLTPSSRQRISPDLTHLIILHLLLLHVFAGLVQTPYQQCPLDSHVSCLRMRFETKMEIVRPRAGDEDWAVQPTA